MSISYKNINMCCKDSNNNLNVLHPITKAKNVIYGSSNIGEAVQGIESNLEDVAHYEDATDFSEAETPQFQQTIDDVLNNVNELKGDLVNTDLAINNITPNVLSATKYDGKEITDNIINEIYNHNGGTYDLTQKLKPTDKVIPRIWFDDGTYLTEISGLVLILQDDNNETVEQIVFDSVNKNSLENATKAFLLNYNATSLNPFKGKVIKGISLEYVDYSEKYGRDLTAYCRGYHPIEKSIYDRITNTELENLINRETNK